MMLLPHASRCSLETSNSESEKNMYDCTTNISQVQGISDVGDESKN